jgi:hypothetical protein
MQEITIPETLDFQILKMLSKRSWRTAGCNPPDCSRSQDEMLFNYIYNIAFVNSERWLAKSRVDITQCQHGNVAKFLSLYFFVLYYKTNIKLFSVLIYSYINTENVLYLLNVIVMDHFPINQNFDLNKSRQNSIIAWRSITKLVIFQSFVAKCCKMRII